MNFHIKNDTAATHRGDSIRSGPIPTLSCGSQHFFIYNKVRPSEQSKGLHIAKGKDCPNGMLKIPLLGRITSAVSHLEPINSKTIK